MNCSWLQTASAFDGVPIRGPHKEAGIEIGTPFSFADGTAIVLYAMEEGDRLLPSDNGEMLAHLWSVGTNINKRLSTLRDRVAPFGLTLTDKGDVRALVPMEQGSHMLATTISAMLSVAEWEREQLGLDEQIKNLADEAEILLREWKPQSILERRPKIRGQAKREHNFDFLLDDEYIDVIAGNYVATGATMRKAGDVKNSPYLDSRSIRVLIDDRSDPERAEVERYIPGSLVESMTLTKLHALATPARPH